jgi:hypothetical protein
MRRLRILIVIVCALGATGAPLVAAPAASAGASQVIADCNAHGSLTRHYSAAELRAALATMNADVKEYTDCYDVIQRALLVALGGIHGGGGDGGQSSSGSFLPTPLLVLLVLLGLAAATLGAVAVRRRGGASSASSGSS